MAFQRALQWRHNDYDGVSNHQPRGCLPNRLFRRRSKKTSKLRVTGLCVGNSPGPVNSPHKGSVTRKMFPFGDVIMGQFHRKCSRYLHSILLIWDLSASPRGSDPELTSHDPARQRLWVTMSLINYSGSQNLKYRYPNTACKYVSYQTNWTEIHNDNNFWNFL